MFRFDKKDEKNRLSFYENIVYGLEYYSSSNSEVNALLNEFYRKVLNYEGNDRKFKTDKDIKLKKDIIKGKSVIREVYIGDIIIAAIFKFLHESATFNIDDKISKLIYRIYDKADRVVHPYQKGNSSDADFMYYVEIKYDK